ncbi:MAG: hypothetical protein U9Q15_01600 [Patescibacteria group bacterium]|nr:hypothetical protein [Patescibacteria group bacterium]
MKLLKWLRVGVLLVMVLVLSGCGRNPMGIPDKQWESLTPEKQAEYTAQQSKIDARRAEAARKARLEREKDERIRKKKEQDRVDALYKNAQYGYIVQVYIQSGQYMYRKGKWGTVKDLVCVLVRGETKKITLRVEQKKGYKREENLWLEYDKHGSAVYVYLEKPSEYARKYNRVDRITLANFGWKLGKWYKKNFIPSKYEGVKNMKINVRYADDNRRVQPKIIIQNPGYYR